MSDIAIRVDRLSKRYRIGALRRHHDTLRDQLSDAFAGLYRRFFPHQPSHSPDPGDSRQRVDPSTSPQDYIWALKDVSLQVKRGEVVGIIGRNGAGKTTLLKLLARITEPTEGYAEIRGRVGSLLEVGTGFHPELTGRENIYLSGAILGMRKREIEEKFDEMVAFAELERFVETPVKRYSSGMYVRLAFAVSAHLEPEILLVDEVLAVGDAAFQKKCLGKMGDVAKEGRTVLFVSHNMATIEHLCSRGAVLEQGRLVFNGKAEEAIAHYLLSGSRNGRDLRDFSGRTGSGLVRIVDVKFRDGHGNLSDTVSCGKPVDILIRYENHGLPKNTSLIVGISLKTAIDAPISLLHNRMAGIEFGDIGETGSFVCHIDPLPLVPSTYRLGLTLMQPGGRYLDSIPDAVELTVEASDFTRSGELPPPSFGPLVLQADWSLEK